jgi:hypothetical protein
MHQGTRGVCYAFGNKTSEATMIVPAKEFRKHAADCRRMAREMADGAARDSWARLAKRWDLCADLAEQEAASAGHLARKDRGLGRFERRTTH